MYQEPHFFSSPPFSRAWSPHRYWFLHWPVLKHRAPIVRGGFPPSFGQKSIIPRERVNYFGCGKDFIHGVHRFDKEVRFHRPSSTNVKRALNYYEFVLGLFRLFDLLHVSESQLIEAYRTKGIQQGAWQCVCIGLKIQCQIWG